MTVEVSLRHAVVVVGGGAGGATVAALLLKQQPQLDVAVIEPAQTHWYQPAWTLVGAGAYDIKATGRPMTECLPDRATHIKARVTAFLPERLQVVLDDGRRVAYEQLVVATGLQLDWGKIDGLTETLGINGVTSNYRHDLAPYTWECIRAFKGGNALFTQPAMPIKCAGAPQKILYMAADRFRRRALEAKLSFFTPGPSMFGVPFYAKALDKIVAEYRITPAFGHNLVAVDGIARRAVFEVKQGDQVNRVERAFDLLHVVPPQSAPDIIKKSPLADASGWVAVDKHTLQHATYKTVFGLGDCTTTPNSKTAAAVRSQAPVVVRNLLQLRALKPIDARYDGYASCPLTTSVGKIMLAEFAYDGVVTPSFPLDPRVPRRAYWWLKRSYLPPLYWGMLRGNLGLDWHKPRTYAETTPKLVA